MKVTTYEGHKVPEGATHVSVDGQYTFIMNSDGIEWYWTFYNTSGNWQSSRKDEFTTDAIELPEQPTKADGWVPVGRCIHLYNDGADALGKEDVTIIGKDKKGNYVFQNDGDCYFSDTAKYFMKAKTADEVMRDMFIDRCFDTSVMGRTVDSEKLFGGLFDAGFTAPEGK